MWLLLALALVVAAVPLAVVHRRVSRGKPLPSILSILVAAFAVVAGVSTIVQLYRIGESGAKATWGPG